MLLRRRRRATNGTEKADPALIAELEIELGLVEREDQLPKLPQVAVRGYFLMSTDPSRPVLKHMWDDA